MTTNDHGVSAIARNLAAHQTEFLIPKSQRERLLKGIFDVECSTFSQGALDSAFRNFNIYP